MQSEIEDFNGFNMTSENERADCNILTSSSDNENHEEEDVLNLSSENENQKEVGVEIDVPTPSVGMEFDSVDDFYKYCLNYARKVGYPVRKRSQRKYRGILKYVTISCARNGKNKSTRTNPVEPQPSSRNGCGSKITANLKDNGKWEITIVHLEHNHILSPGKVRHYRCNRKINRNVARQLEICDMAGTKVSQSYRQQVVAAGGHENVPFRERDCRNLIQKKRSIRLGDGDSAAIQQYFLTMQRKNNGFIFCIDLDDESRLRNVFWADRRSREAYKEFGDVVTFDTTYLTNKYHLPFAPFVGVNHHGQSILLGCGLLSNEDTDSFVWLFRTWLSCMEDRAPTGIITDQDKAMQKAIEIVFPNTRHRWCIWHVMKKVPQYLRSYKNYHLISLKLHECVYETLSTEEFEIKWRDMIEKYSLQEHKWLDFMYTERKRWVPIFVKNNFWAGMSSTQRSESMNAFFDGYVSSKTSLKLFVEQYNEALKDKVEKEALADFKSYTFDLPCVSPFKIEKQMRSVYTLEKFKEFQIEIVRKMACDVVGVRTFGHICEYDVSECKEFGEGNKISMYGVLFDSVESEVKCNCYRFESTGILCRHALTVLWKNQIDVIPEKYILRRWRKDVKRSHTKISVNYGGWDTPAEQKRYDRLYLAFSDLADGAAADDESEIDLHNYLLKYKPKEKSQQRMSTSSGKSNSSGYTIDCEDNARQDIRDPVSIKVKGRPRENRLKKKIYKPKKRISASTMPTCDPINAPVSDQIGNPKEPQGSSFVGNVNQHNMFFAPNAGMTYTELLEGVYRPQMNYPPGEYGGVHGYATTTTTQLMAENLPEDDGF